MQQPKDQLTQDIEYLFAHDQYLRIVKRLENRRDQIISDFSKTGLTPDDLNQLAGQIREVNEVMAELGYFKAKEMQRYRQI
jgi:transcriptional accessory protein Tex/SPT6